MARLTKDSLSTIPAEARPTIDTPGVGIVHLGVGAFHRAHQAVYTEDAIAAGGGDWAIAEVAPNSTAVVDAMRAQDGLFSVTSLSGAGARTRVIAAVGRVLHAPSERSAVTGLLADPAIRVVTLTVTEKAYQPGSAMVKLLVDGIRARIIAGAPPLAVVSCDNLPSNGSQLRALIAEAVELPKTVTFPRTMVDRIVPASTDQTYALVRNALGVEDQAAVEAEPYKQWVIEDAFPGGRPAWDLAGAVLTDDVAPWEQLKLRTLNGVHSTVAYLGAVAGYETIADALRMPGLTDVLRQFIADEIAQSFTPPPGVSVVEYGDEVLERFADPAVRYRTVQVAMDGSQKLPYRVLRTVLDSRARGLSPRVGALVVAAWMRFAEGTADDGTALPLNDPMAPQIKAKLAASGSVVDQLLSLREIFPAELAADEEFRSLVHEWYRALTAHGVRATLSAIGGAS
ncbi:fructuronate reductase [Hamadaea flava]|uniref:Mannitol-1-phosphate 5-dehydrogenase n=1 Tax=Hamadaea flava TaxID=1742688 RepID=A0ABV8M1I3_9ACTN|nr:mannitol dehydrogenase family protein [Hamadaea flava]MCP2325791.1 fructuronate reductase [Hamadaea flava]